MSFTLPDLPYQYDALAPYMSRETLEYHHDKHHLAYVNTANNLIKGSQLTQGSQSFADVFSFARQSAMSRGRPVEIRDVQIAGIVAARKANLATRNLRHFEGIGLTLEIGRAHV